jgi:heat shock transcription factor
MFRKGGKDLLCEIRRRKAWANKQQPVAPTQSTPQESDEDQRSSSTSSSSGFSTLIDENKRLKKENGVLSSELSSIKRKCKELLDLVAKYAHSEEDERPKLFGVRLEVQGEREMKRKRAEISASASILLSQSCK